MRLFLAQLLEADQKMMTANPVDEFDALKTMAETLKPFKADEQSRMLRWISEKLVLAPAVALPQTLGETRETIEGVVRNPAA